jgi:DNA-binding NarL/FixJ family response regulator
MKLLIVEDHPTTRLGIRTVLELADHEVAGEVETKSEALRLADELNPDLVMVDLRLKDAGAGIELCRELKTLANPPLVLAYTAYNSVEELAAVRAAGADGFVHKSEDPAGLLDAVESLQAGKGVWLLGNVTEDPNVDLVQALKHAYLTEREREVFELLRRRRTDPEIAQGLSISLHTAKAHVSNVLRKLGFKSRRDIA